MKVHRSSMVLCAVMLLGGGGFGQTTERASVDSSGNQSDGDSFFSSISWDGSYVGFQSDASNLVTGDTNGEIDIFGHDFLTSATELLSVDSSGNQGNAHSLSVSVSGDARYVAFHSDASNLVPGDTNGWRDVFVHDRQTGATELVSVDSSGTQGDGDSAYPSISGDGRYVAFYSFATNLVPSDIFNGDIFVHDRHTDATEQVSIDSSGQAGNGDSHGPSISGDGRYVAFYSRATNLVPGDTNGDEDVFVHDRLTGVTERVSVDSSGNQGNAGSGDPSISVDGRYVAFQSGASNLVPGDTNTAIDVFVHDRVTGITERVSVDSSGNQGNDNSNVASTSGGGRFVAFSSRASNLVPGDTNGEIDVFVHDRQTAVTERVSVDSSGSQGNSGSANPSISSDGRYVAFQSDASNLVPADTNGDFDVFVRDRGIQPEVYCTAGISASGCQAAISATGQASASAASGFALIASGVEGGKDGQFFFGTSGQQASPWGNGTSFQCVLPPVTRAGLLTGSGTTGLCDGSFSQDLNAMWCPTCPKPGKNPGAGALVQAQLWYRDPLSTSNQTTSLSNAIEFVTAP
jgi:Tol biopolymer transport system component